MLSFELLYLIMRNIKKAVTHILVTASLIKISLRLSLNEFDCSAHPIYGNDIQTFFNT